MNKDIIDKKVENIIHTCLIRWDIKTDDDRIIKFKAELPFFIEEFDESSFEIIGKLLTKFDYFSHENTNKCLKELYEKIMEEYELVPELTVFSSIKSNTGRINSSNDYISEFRILNGISKNYVYTDIDIISKLETWQYFDTVVLVDDICGSGDTFKSFIKERKDIFDDKKIIYLVICAMDKAIKKIQRYAHNNGLDVEIVCYKKYERALEDTLLKKQKDDFIMLSKDLEIYGEDILGHGNSEALIAYYNNTPNNTLGVFRKTTNKNHAIFPRSNDQRIDIEAMKKSREKRKTNNYNNRMVCLSE